MKWISHKAVTSVSVFALTGNIPITILTMVGSILPDKIEQILFCTKKTWNKYHRTYFHWMPLYIIIISALFFYLKLNNEFYDINNLSSFHYFNLHNLMSIYFLCNICIWLFIGCVFHILEDSICGEIPLINPQKRFKFIRLFYVGTIKEYLYVFLFCLSVCFLKFLY